MQGVLVASIPRPQHSPILPASEAAPLKGAAVPEARKVNPPPQAAQPQCEVAAPDTPPARVPAPQQLTAAQLAAACSRCARFAALDNAEADAIAASIVAALHSGNAAMQVVALRGCLNVAEQGAVPRAKLVKAGALQGLQTMLGPPNPAAAQITTAPALQQSAVGVLRELLQPGAGAPSICGIAHKAGVLTQLLHLLCTGSPQLASAAAAAMAPLLEHLPAARADAAAGGAPAALVALHSRAAAPEAVLALRSFVPLTALLQTVSASWAGTPKPRPPLAAQAPPGGPTPTPPSPLELQAAVVAALQAAGALPVLLVALRPALEEATRPAGLNGVPRRRGGALAAQLAASVAQLVVGSPSAGEAALQSGLLPQGVMKLLESGQIELQVSAAAIAGNAALAQPRARDALARCGACPLLVRLLSSQPPGAAAAAGGGGAGAAGAAGPDAAAAPPAAAPPAKPKGRAPGDGVGRDGTICGVSVAALSGAATAAAATALGATAWGSVPYTVLLNQDGAIAELCRCLRSPHAPIWCAAAVALGRMQLRTHATAGTAVACGGVTVALQRVTSCAGGAPAAAAGCALMLANVLATLPEQLRAVLAQGGLPAAMATFQGTPDPRCHDGGVRLLSQLLSERGAVQAFVRQQPPIASVRLLLRLMQRPLTAEGGGAAAQCLAAMAAREADPVPRVMLDQGTFELCAFTLGIGADAAAAAAAAGRRARKPTPEQQAAVLRLVARLCACMQSATDAARLRGSGLVAWTAHQVAALAAPEGSGRAAAGEPSAAAAPPSAAAADAKPPVLRAALLQALAAMCAPPAAVVTQRPALCAEVLGARGVLAAAAASLECAAAEGAAGNAADARAAGEARRWAAAALGALAGGGHAAAVATVPGATDALVGVAADRDAFPEAAAAAAATLKVVAPERYAALVAIEAATQPLGPPVADGAAAAAPAASPPPPAASQEAAAASGSGASAAV